VCVSVTVGKTDTACRLSRQTIIARLTKRCSAYREHILGRSHAIESDVLDDWTVCAFRVNNVDDEVVRVGVSRGGRDAVQEPRDERQEERERREESADHVCRPRSTPLGKTRQVCVGAGPACREM